jgi:hypothetical protein
MPVIFTGTDRLSVGDLNFRFSAAHGVTTRDEIFLYKDRQFVDSYIDRLSAIKPKRVFEFGIYQGGSALFLTSAFDLERYSCLDISHPLPELDAILHSHSVGKRITAHFRTSQDDAAAVRRFMAEDFKGEPLDLIIDDASHLYELTKRSFEISWPFLKVGGHYIIEDWAWAHWDSQQYPGSGWENWLAPTNLVFELVMVLGSTGLIKSMEIHPSFVMLQKSNAVFDFGDAWIDGVIKMRGRTLNKI